MTYLLRDQRKHVWPSDQDKSLRAQPFCGTYNTLGIYCKTDRSHMRATPPVDQEEAPASKSTPMCRRPQRGHCVLKAMSSSCASAITCLIAVCSPRSICALSGSSAVAAA